MAPPKLSTVIVAHDSLTDLRLSLPPLIAQLDIEDELIVVDSGSGDGLSRELSAFAPTARLITAPGNVGFAAGANLGVDAAAGELIVLLNPDTIIDHGWVAAIKAPWGGPWAAWMALVTMDGGAVINSSGGVLHFTGLGWAGQAGRPVDDAPTSPTEVGFLSGACMAIPSSTWHELGGFSEPYFMYCEDVDLSLRLRLRGNHIGVIPAARVTHAYDFDKGSTKWRLLERNRWATVLRTYPSTLLILVLPALMVVELGIWAVAVRGGWGRMKLLATFDVIRAMPRLADERRTVQRARTVDPRAFAQAMTAELSSRYFGGIGSGPLIATALRTYWHLVLRVLS